MAVKYQEDYGVFIHELYETYSRLIYKEAWKYFDSIYDVEDLVQEVWIKLCQAETAPRVSARVCR